MNVKPSVNQRKVRLQRRTKPVVNHSIVITVSSTVRGAAKKAIKIDLLLTEMS